MTSRQSLAAIPLALGLASQGLHSLSSATSPATAAPAITAAGASATSGPKSPPAGSAPVPLLKDGQPVDWWFAFKFNAESFPECGGPQRTCLLGGDVQTYSHFSQQFAYASSLDHTLKNGGGCVGDTVTDPVGATANEVYNGNYFYVVWNDQFYGDPLNTESAPAGHSKGLLAWGQDGSGFVMQVSTPSWPGSGSATTPRALGNSLGCVKGDNNAMVSQHFFTLKLSKSDTAAVLTGLGNASVVTDPTKPQIVNNGGPADIQALVKGLGHVSKNTTAIKTTLSSGVVLISKPSDLKVPPWQLVSSMLGGEPLRVASWWANPEIPSTTATTPVGCWDSSLVVKPGAVDIATSGTWAGKSIGLEGMAEPQGNHAKVAVSTGTHTYAIFGDMNQQGSLSGPNCGSSQNGRGGLFYVVDDQALFNGVRDLLKGDSATPK